MPQTVADRFRVVALLGKGGMGSVFHVFDTQTEEERALKRLTLTGDARRDGRLQEMFKREYRVLAQLSHPSVVRVYDFGLDAVGPYYTMELLQGEDLYSKGQVPWRDACRYMRDVSSCLALLHSRRLIHRDISPRNVRCNGPRAKLLDFGAMAPMGPTSQVVGTPCMVAPEALDGRALDARYDLYALGGTLYWTLTGQNAYPVRTLGQLEHAWQRPPPAPSQVVPGIPEALDALVTSLLSLDPDARPRTAAEVMQTLSALAELPDDETLHVPLAYLATPALRGRKAELSAVRTAIRKTAPQGSLMLKVRGEPGMGCTRVLDASVVEARLLGARTLRLECGGAIRSADDVARALLEQLTHGATAAAASAPAESDRMRLHDRAEQALQAACQQHVVVVALDDVDRLEVHAQDYLGAVAQVVPKNLLVVMTTHSPVASAKLRAMIETESRLVLEPLDITETEALLHSMFGEVPGLGATVSGIYELSNGNPRATMELAQHLVDTGKARYEMGRWVLPTRLLRDDLPQAWTEAIDTRLRGLNEDQQQVAQALIYVNDYQLPIDTLDQLTSHGDAQRRMAAMDDLLAGGLLRIEAGQYHFSSTTYGDRLRALCSPERNRFLHGRLAETLQVRGHDAIDVARFQLLAGEPDRAIDTLLHNLEGGTRWETAPEHYADTLEQAIESCAKLKRPRKDCYQLKQELIYVGEHLGVANMREHFVELVDMLVIDSGLQDFNDLPEDMEHGLRMKTAIETAAARFESAPEHERLMHPLLALKDLAFLNRRAAAFASVAMDADLLDAMPSLAPFANLSPALEMSVKYTFPAAQHLTAARFEEARRCFSLSLARASQPDRAGLDAEYHNWALRALNFALGHLEAGFGDGSALERANYLLQDPTWEIGGWTVRAAYYRRYGDWNEAEHCRQQVERLRLSASRRPPLVDTGARLELDAAAHSGDLTEAQRAMERIQELIPLHPGYAPYAHFGPASIEFIAGNYAGALDHAEKALAMMEAGRHPTWPWVVDCILSALLKLERYEEARQRGRQFLREAEAIELGLMAHHAAVPLALAEAKLGDIDTAIARVETCTAHREALGCRGINLGWIYEARARIAIIEEDPKAFEAAAARCATEYGHGRSGSSLAKKYQTLRLDAQRAGLDKKHRSARELGNEAPVTILTSRSRVERFHGVLQELMDACHAPQGALFRLKDDALKLRAHVGSDVQEAPLLALAQEALNEILGDDETVTGETCYDDGNSKLGFHPIILGHFDAGPFTVCGVAVVYRSETFEAAPLPLIEHVARTLERTPATAINTPSTIH